MILLKQKKCCKEFLLSEVFILLKGFYLIWVITTIILCILQSIELISMFQRIKIEFLFIIPWDYLIVSHYMQVKLIFSHPKIYGRSNNQNHNFLHGILPEHLIHLWYDWFLRLILVLQFIQSWFLRRNFLHPARRLWYKEHLQPLYLRWYDH